MEHRCQTCDAAPSALSTAGSDRVLWVGPTPWKLESRNSRCQFPTLGTPHHFLRRAVYCLVRARVATATRPRTRGRAGMHVRAPTTISSGITGAYGKQKRRQLIRERKKESSSPTQPNPSSPGPSHAITLGEKQRADGSCMRQSKKKKLSRSTLQSRPKN
jgi:hypothetical protein